jgi:hypothetical protein
MDIRADEDVMPCLLFLNGICLRIAYVQILMGSFNVHAEFCHHCTCHSRYYLSMFALFAERKLRLIIPLGLPFVLYFSRAFSDENLS